MQYETLKEKDLASETRNVFLVSLDGSGSKGEEAIFEERTGAAAQQEVAAKWDELKGARRGNLPTGSYSMSANFDPEAPDILDQLDNTTGGTFALNFTLCDPGKKYRDVMARQDYKITEEAAVRAKETLVESVRQARARASDAKTALSNSSEWLKSRKMAMDTLASQAGSEKAGYERGLTSETLEAIAQAGAALKDAVINTAYAEIEYNNALADLKAVIGLSAEDTLVVESDIDTIERMSKDIRKITRYFGFNAEDAANLMTEISRFEAAFDKFYEARHGHFDEAQNIKALEIMGKIASARKTAASLRRKSEIQKDVEKSRMEAELYRALGRKSEGDLESEALAKVSDDNAPPLERIAICAVLREKTPEKGAELDQAMTRAAVKWIEMVMAIDKEKYLEKESDLLDSFIKNHRGVEEFLILKRGLDAKKLVMEAQRIKAKKPRDAYMLLTRALSLIDEIEKSTNGLRQEAVGMANADEAAALNNEVKEGFEKSIGAIEAPSAIKRAVRFAWGFTTYEKREMEKARKTKFDIVLDRVSEWRAIDDRDIDLIEI